MRTNTAIQSGIIPANTTVDITVSYNNLIYAFPNGIRALFFGNDRPDGLIVTKYPADSIPVIKLPNAIPVVTETAFDVQMYPNPTNNVVSIRTSQSSTIRVYDYTGALVKQLACTGTQQLSFGDVVKGIYLVECTSIDGQQAIKKLVVQ